jgi:hypothetical protein
MRRRSNSPQNRIDWEISTNPKAFRTGKKSP